MNILLLIPEVCSPPPLEGGGQMFLHHVCVELYRLGHRVEVLTASKDGDLEFDAQQTYSVRRHPVSRWRLCSALIIVFETLFYVLKERTDVVIIGHFATVETLGVWLLHKIFRLPYVLLIHGLDLQSYLRSKSKIHKTIIHTVLRNASLALANSRFTGKKIVEAGYVGKIIVLNPGVDTERFRPNLPTVLVREKYNLTSRNVILSVARLVRRKGHANVLRALALILDEIPDITYLIAGRGEEEESLRALAKELMVQEHVRFLGYVNENELPYLYCACDIFVLPTISFDEEGDYEGFGIVFSEANACAKPVVGGNSGGVSDSVMDGITGILIDPNNVDGIAKAIILLLSDKQNARGFGIKGRMRVEEELAWPIVGKKLETVLQSLIRK